MNLGEDQIPDLGDLGTRTQYRRQYSGWQAGGPSNVFTHLGSALGSVFGSGQRQSRDFRTQIKQNIISGAVGQAIEGAGLDARISTFNDFYEKNSGLRAANLGKGLPSFENPAEGNTKAAQAAAAARAAEAEAKGKGKSYEELQKSHDDLSSRFDNLSRQFDALKTQNTTGGRNPEPDAPKNPPSSDPTIEPPASKITKF